MQSGACPPTVQVGRISTKQCWRLAVGGARSAIERSGPPQGAAQAYQATRPHRLSLVQRRRGCMVCGPWPAYDISAHGQRGNEATRMICGPWPAYSMNARAATAQKNGDSYDRPPTHVNQGWSEVLNNPVPTCAALRH